MIAEPFLSVNPSPAEAQRRNLSSCRIVGRCL